jgi:hypothetical protein
MLDLDAELANLSQPKLDEEIPKEPDQADLGVFEDNPEVMAEAVPDNQLQHQEGELSDSDE